MASAINQLRWNILVSLSNYMILLYAHKDTVPIKSIRSMYMHVQSGEEKI